METRMALTRRDLLEKSLALGAGTAVSLLDPSGMLSGLAEPINSLALAHVTVIDATGKPALPDQTIVVVGDRIQTVGNSSETKIPKNAKVIDAGGKYMIPGLWDMHVHFRGGQGLIPDNEAWLSIFLANGITGIREARESSPQDRSWTVPSRSGPDPFLLLIPPQLGPRWTKQRRSDRISSRSTPWIFRRMFSQL